MLRIWADFNALSHDRKTVPLHKREFIASFKPDLRVVLYEPDDFEVEATLKLEKLEDGTEVWFGIVDWDTYSDISS